MAKKFTHNDPDGNGVHDTYGMALQGKNPRNLIHMLDLFTQGTGIKHTLIHREGYIVTNNPRNINVASEFLKLFTHYKYVHPSSAGHTFTEMYELIENNRVGAFRVGDWNVRKWDSSTLRGDYIVGPWPAFHEGDTNQVVIGGMRGVAVPENSPNKREALKFAEFLLSQKAQSASLKHIGSVVRDDIPIDGLSENQRFFIASDVSSVMYDFPESFHPHYPELEKQYHALLRKAISSPPKNWNEFFTESTRKLERISQIERRASILKD